MTVIKLRKRQLTILELAGVTAWIGIGLIMFPFNFFAYLHLGIVDRNQDA